VRVRIVDGKGDLWPSFHFGILRAPSKEWKERWRERVEKEREEGRERVEIEWKKEELGSTLFSSSFAANAKLAAQ